MEPKFQGSTPVVWMAMMLVSGLTGAMAADRVFVLEKSQPGLLCGYIKEREWAQVPKDKEIEILAVVSSTSGIVSSILVQRFTEDTNTYDEYAIDRNGNVLQLKRTLDILPDRVTREQTWKIRDGRAAKVSDSWTQLKTHRPITPDEYLQGLGQNPIMFRISDFPFYPLIADKHSEQWPSGTRCIPGSMNKLEAPGK